MNKAILDELEQEITTALTISENLSFPIDDNVEALCEAIKEIEGTFQKLREENVLEFKKHESKAYKNFDVFEAVNDRTKKIATIFQKRDGRSGAYITKYDIALFASLGY